jgi:Arylsulfotransferase (ASST)
MNANAHQENLRLRARRRRGHAVGSRRPLVRLVVAASCVAALTVPGKALADDAQTDTYTFVSAPGLHPPKLDVLEEKHGLADGDLLMAVQGSPNPDERGPLILDGNLQPVWFSNRGGGPVFQQETYEGHPVLVWAQGNPTTGTHGGGKPGSPHVMQIGRETVIVVNEHYRTVAKLTARRPWNIDGHDISIIGNDVWVPVDRAARHRDLARYGGPKDASVFDTGIQEYQLSTGRLLRTWDPLTLGRNRGVPLSASKESGRAAQYDPYHINSVQVLPDGDVLVSMRNTWAVYLIDPRTDKIIWTLGGKDSTFKFGKGATFDWQHDAQLVDPGQGGLGSDVKLTLFDNNSSQGPARGLTLRLNTITDKTTLVAAYRRHPPVTASVGGSMQVLSNGNALVGWGSPSAEFTEFSKSGSQLLDARFPLGETIYRALLTDTWVGTPYYPPSGAVRGTTAYASWNGATEVAEWEVLAGSSAGNLHVVAAHARTGFETAITLADTYALYEIQALSSTGRVLGTSKSFS